MYNIFVRLLYQRGRIQGTGVTFWYTPIFQYTLWAYTNGIPICVNIVYHLACTTQPGWHAGMEQVVTFARGWVVEYCANQNATPIFYQWAKSSAVYSRPISSRGRIRATGMFHQLSSMVQHQISSAGPVLAPTHPPRSTKEDSTEPDLVSQGHRGRGYSDTSRCGPW